MPYTAEQKQTKIAELEAKIADMRKQRVVEYDHLRRLPTDELRALVNQEYRIPPGGTMRKSELVYAILDRRFDATYLERQLARLRSA